MNLYRYEGPIFLETRSGVRTIKECWIAYTRAKTMKQAKNNLKYQAKQQLGFNLHSHVILPSILVEETYSEDGEQLQMDLSALNA